ncbi:aldehyde dehydrogenase family protein [Mycobacterium paraintracellulare]|uniref:aldehyde dehydrogenase family protein n=1 Tax=Mycobacterium paraintracellulare TaxID=1138383 RepID=UPI001915C160|nr:aldehyde dehydrogenase family protein [Mycobacterium paraintracellulare]
MPIATINPADNATVKEFDEFTDQQVDDAIDAADSAYPPWRAIDKAARAAILAQAAQLLSDRAGEFAPLLTLEMGKLIGESKAEVALASAILKYYADNGEEMTADESIEVDDGSAIVRTCPIGALLGVMPWNFPLYQVVRFVGPNLLLGNTVLIKHASSCPQSALALEKLFADAGAPAGVYKNLFVSGSKIARIIDNPKIKAVSLTGSEGAGASVAEQAGKNLKESVLELGSSDPFIVLDEGGDFGRLIEGAATGRMASTGQSCVVYKRSFVHKDPHDNFVNGLAAAFASLRVGDTQDESTTLGSLSSEQAAQDLEELVHDAFDRGATAAVGGHRAARPGAYCQATVYAVFVLSSLMFDGRDADAVLALAADSVPSLSGCETEAAYRVEGESLWDSRIPGRQLDSNLDESVAVNLGVDREIRLSDGAWRYAITLRGLKGITGVLVVRAPDAPSSENLFLLKVLAQQAAAAMTSAAAVGRAYEQQVRLRDLTEERARTIDHLSRVVTELERHEQIHKALTGMPASGSGETGIADALHQLTSLPVAIEDTFGNLRAWSGDAEPAKYRPIGGANRTEVLRRAEASGKLQRDGKRLFTVVRPQADILGVLVLYDPDRRADNLDRFALEYAASVLALEMSHQRALAEAELRLRRELVEDLLAGTDDDSAYARSEALGHNLRTPHSVAVLQWENTDSLLVVRATRKWADAAGVRPLIAGRPAAVVLVTEGAPEPAKLHQAISQTVGSNRGSIGLGSVAAVPSELPRSLSEAQRALGIQQASPEPHGARRYEDLGVYRILDPGGSGPEVRGFMLEWLGALLRYDRAKRTELVKTLGHYLETGGNYDMAAQSLGIHRSTLRYRLGRIRDISGRDLQDVDTRLNLHLATRVLDVIGEPTEEVEHG